MKSSVDKASPVVGQLAGAEQKFDVEAFAKSYGGATRLTLRSGAHLYVQGEPENGLFYIQKGQLQLTVVSPFGKEAILSVLGAGDFCGESCLVPDHIRAATAMCITDSVVTRLERSSVVRAIRENPAFAEFFVVCVIKRAFRLRDNLTSQLFDSTERRLARLLLLLANYEQGGRPATAIDNHDQEALAQMIGTTRSRVNHFMNKFRKLGYIDYNGHIDVHGSLLNVVLHDDPPNVAEARKKASG
jgi:CRP-like cAMP-binding protein